MVAAEQKAQERGCIRVRRRDGCAVVVCERQRYRHREEVMEHCPRCVKRFEAETQHTP